VQSGTLGVDFASRTYNTNLTLTTDGQAQHNFSASGSFNAGTGIMLGKSGTDAAPGSLAGALSFDGRQAGYLFKSPAGTGAFSGATSWGR